MLYDHKGKLIHNESSLEECIEIVARRGREKFIEDLEKGVRLLRHMRVMRLRESIKRESNRRCTDGVKP